MFNSPGSELGNKKDKGDIRRLLDQYGGVNEVNPKSPESATFIDVAKERLKEESGLDWDLEMMKAKEDPNPMSRKHRVDALEDMLATKTNTLGRKTMRSWDTLNEWANKTNFSKNSGVNTMKELVKVATRLDSFGLTKEADVIDALIRKIATEVPYGETPASLKSDHNQKGFATFSGSGDYGRNDWMRKVELVMAQTNLSEDEAIELVDRMEWEDHSNRFGDDDSATELYNPHLHGTPSYEMDTDSIHEGIDSDRELESMFPAEHSFRRSSSTRRGMRKSS